MILKVFISQPMSGVDESVVLSNIDSIEEKIKYAMTNNPSIKNVFNGEMVIKVIDQYHQETPILTKLYNLGYSIQLMDFADFVVFSSNYKTSRGCLVEKMICETYEIPYIEESSLDDLHLVSSLFYSVFANRILKQKELLSYTDLYDNESYSLAGRPCIFTKHHVDE